MARRCEACDAIQALHAGAKGDLKYFRIFHLAASREADVAVALAPLQVAGKAIAADAIKDMVAATPDRRRAVSDRKLTPAQRDDTSSRSSPSAEPTRYIRDQPDSLISRLDRHVERMTKEHPGLDFTRADAVRC